MKSAFNNFIYEYDATDRSQSDVSNDLARMLRIRFKSNAPRRPPRVILLGPPGSGRSTQANAISRKFGLVHLCTRTILKNEISKNSTTSKIIQLCIDEGRMVPDNQVLPLIEARLRQTDCKVNGWILDGFPQNESQIALLKSLNIKPSIVCVFEQAEEMSIIRVSHRRVDPETGDHYNLTFKPPTEESIAKRLLQVSEDNEEVVKQRIQRWNETVPLIEEAFKKVLLNIQTENSIQ